MFPTPEQRKRLKSYYQRFEALNEKWVKDGYPLPPPQYELFPDDLRDIQCGAKTRGGTPCKQRAIFANSRCKWHGGMSTGPRTKKGKKRAAMNGKCPKKKRSHVV